MTRRPLLAVVGPTASGKTQVSLMVAEALGKSVSVRDLCAEKFKDYQFGLKLVAQNTGQESFTIDHDAVAAPDQILSDWVVASYRTGQAKNSSGS